MEPPVLQVEPPRRTWARTAARNPITRMLVAILAVGLALSAVNLVMSAGGIVRPWIRPLATILAVHSAYLLFVRWYERRAVVELDRWSAGRGLLLGSLVGASLVTAVVAVTWMAGGYVVEAWNGWSGMPMAFLSVAAVAYAEEILFRGIVYRLVEEAGGTWLALLISGALFGLMHLGNPGASVVAAGALALEAGILLGALFALTRRLWLPIGVHLGWNFSVGNVFGLSVSGTQSAALVDSRMVGPEWLTGGAFGIEASAAAILICCAVATLVLFMTYRRGHIVQPPWRRQTSRSRPDPNRPPGASPRPR